MLLEQLAYESYNLKITITYKQMLIKIAFGGGCHWCTEAVFQYLKGVQKVHQGWVASTGDHSSFSEAVIIHFFTNQISLKTLIAIHLYTHKSTSEHSMRKKYRSAIYTFSEEQKFESIQILKEFQNEFDNKIITKVYPFSAFKPNTENFQEYYKKNPKKPFCETFINPKLRLLLNMFSKNVKTEELSHLIN